MGAPSQTATDDLTSVQEVVLAYNYILVFLLLRFAPFHWDPDIDGENCPLVESLRREVERSTLPDSSKSWAHQIADQVALSWKLMMEQRAIDLGQRKPQ